MYYSDLPKAEQEQLDTLDAEMQAAKTVYLQKMKVLAEYEKTLRSTFKIGDEYLILRTHEKQVPDQPLVVTPSVPVVEELVPVLDVKPKAKPGPKKK